MKFSQRKGFTLVELMIVIVLLTMFFVIMRHFMSNNRIYQEKVNELAQKTHDIIRDARHNMIVGKQIKNENIISRTIVIDNDNESITITGSWTNNNSVEEKKYILKNEDKFFNIENIEITTKNPNDQINFDSDSDIYTVTKVNFTFDSDGSWKIIIPDNNWEQIKNKDKIQDSAKIYRITLEYRGFKKYLVWNIRTGNIEIRNEADKNIKTNTSGGISHDNGGGEGGR